RCRRIFEFRDDTLENLQIKIAATHGFHMLQHKMEIYGICSDCLKERRQVVPLSATKQGEQLIVKGFNGGANARMRLMTMGLRIGDKIEVITNLDKGQVSIAVDQKRYILGRGLAQKVLVEHIRS
ncbi:MAG: FeoA domain-containing protein, partial [Desulfobacterales bacterium]|nr:FeoA domain-containing protein [Desulfobacterales bacterium]